MCTKNPAVILLKLYKEKNVCLLNRGLFAKTEVWKIIRKQIRPQHDNLICCCQGICHHRFNLVSKLFLMGCHSQNTLVCEFIYI